MFSGPTNAQPVYQTIAPPYAQPSALAPQELAPQPPMHPYPWQLAPAQGQVFTHQNVTNPQNSKKNHKGKGNKGN